jgi:hypothetical protein
VAKALPAAAQATTGGSKRMKIGMGFFDGGTLLILTNGFAKKTQKTPPQEIALAVRRKEEYLARRKKP